MDKPLILYHDSCADGFCAAWVAHKKFGDEADYWPVQYGQAPPTPALQGGRRLFVLDFSYKRQVMIELAQTNTRITVLDHHKTAQAELEGLKATGLSITFDMGKSGARLTWEHFFPGESAPWLVSFTEDRDLWKWALPKSREVSAALASRPWTFAEWDGLYARGSDRPPVSFEEEGAAILRYQTQQVDSAVKNAVEIDLAGHSVLAVNATLLMSEIASKLAEGRPFGATFFIRGDGKKVWSLRSRDDGVDVSQIARERGGGGHRNAAGFEQ